MHQTRAHTPAQLPILVVGRGRVGGAINRAGIAAGLDMASAGRDDLAALAPAATTALLCVPDAEIADACAAVVAAAPEIRFVGHSSGASGLDRLEAARRAGARTFSLHPLQTVPDSEAELVGCPAAIAGCDDEALVLAQDLAQRLAMRPFEVTEESRAAYHAAAAIASNFLIALESSAVELLEAAGVADLDEARELLAPLVLRSAANWAERGPAALTGPIARGDEETVERHLAAIDGVAPELLSLYHALAERTRAIAAGREGVGS
jgi:predicted short-subunit dehydrogenase-like oxidoreductase (DUF2520 family)